MRDPEAPLKFTDSFLGIPFYSFINLVVGKVLLISESMYYLCSLTRSVVLKAV